MDIQNKSISRINNYTLKRHSFDFFPIIVCPRVLAKLAESLQYTSLFQNVTDWYIIIIITLYTSCRLALQLLHTLQRLIDTEQNIGCLICTELLALGIHVLFVLHNRYLFSEWERNGSELDNEHTPHRFLIKN